MAAKLKYRVVVVSWVDSEHHSDWDNLSEVLESQGSLECLSAGFVIADNEDRIILATSISADAEENEEQVSAYITIPKRAILWVKELRPKSPAKKKETLVGQV